MKLILWLSALFAAAIVVILATESVVGHVVIQIPPYQLELPLDQFIIGVIAAFFIFNILFGLILGILGWVYAMWHG